MKGSVSLISQSQISVEVNNSRKNTSIFPSRKKTKIFSTILYGFVFLDNKHQELPDKEYLRDGQSDLNFMDQQILCFCFTFQ